MFRELMQLCDTFTCVGWLICPEGHVSLLNKSNPIQYCTLQEHMVNGQCLATMVTRSRQSSGQDMGLGGLGMANLKSDDYNLFSSG